MGAVAYRPAGPLDVPALVALCLEARLAAGSGPYGNVAPAVPPPTVPPGLASDLADELTAELALLDAEAILFEVGDEVAGFALFRRVGSEIQLHRFVVAPAFRAEGLGVEAFRWLYDNLWVGVTQVQSVGACEPGLA